MASTSEALGANGAQHELTIDGVAIKFGLITQRIKSELERWLYQRAIKGLIGAKEILNSKDALGSTMAFITNDLAAGKYAWGGQMMIDSLGTLSGICKLMSLISFDINTCKQVPPEKVEDWFLGDHSAELGHLFGVIFTESMPKKKVTDQDQEETQSQTVKDSDR